MCWCVLNGSVCLCAGVCPFDLLGCVFLVHVGMYRFVLHGWHRDLHGYSSVLSFGQVVSSYMLDHVCYILRKLWLYFQTHHQMIIQSKTVSQCYKYLLH